MNWLMSIGTVVLLGAWGCGGIAVIDGDGAGGSGGSSADIGSSVSVNSSSSSGSSAAFQLTFVEALAGANCQPVVPPDPLRVSVIVNADNQFGPDVGVSVESARMTGAAGTTSFKTNPSDFIIASGSLQSLELEKVEDSSVGTNGCSYCGSTDLVVELELLVDGAPLALSGPVSSVGCAF